MVETSEHSSDSARRHKRKDHRRRTHTVQSNGLPRRTNEKKSAFVTRPQRFNGSSTGFPHRLGLTGREGNTTLRSFMIQRCAAGVSRMVRPAAMLLLLTLASPAAAADAVLYRIFLRDGSTLVSYGEFARVGDQVVFSI